MHTYHYAKHFVDNIPFFFSLTFHSHFFLFFLGKENQEMCGWHGKYKISIHNHFNVNHQHKTWKDLSILKIHPI